jgi:nicotinamidase/pyrazinamidase
MTSLTKIHVVIVDPQMDFCTPNGTYNIPTGMLFVPGADQDMKRLAAFVHRVNQKIADIHVTLDSHHLLDVAHPLFWKNSKGQNPAPFTVISVSDIEHGVWTPSIPSLQQRMLAYIRALEKGGRYPLCIWPPHCLIGTPGQAVVPELMDALNEWATLKHATIDFITKGSNPFTEHYSAIRAEVPDPSDPTTHSNRAFIQTLEDADVVLCHGAG